MTIDKNKAELIAKHKQDIETLLSSINIRKYDVNCLHQAISADFQAKKISFDEFCELYNMLPWID